MIGEILKPSISSFREIVQVNKEFESYVDPHLNLISSCTEMFFPYITNVRTYFQTNLMLYSTRACLDSIFFSSELDATNHVFVPYKQIYSFSTFFEGKESSTMRTSSLSRITEKYGTDIN